MLIFFWPEGPISPHRFNIFNISPVLSIKKKTFNISRGFASLLSRNPGNVTFFRKVLKTGEMLNMLNVLGPKAPFRPTDLTYLAYLTFPLFSGESV